MASLLGLLKTNKATIKATAASNKLYNPVHRPVGIFLGGTSGIGEAMATQLANQTGGRAHIILLGRNEEAAKRIIDRFPTATTDNATDAVSQQGQGQGAEGSKYEFIKVDATSMKSVREVTSRLNKELTKVNFIVATAGFTTSKGRDPTPPPESIDRKMACNFYARFRLIHDLIPLVEKAAANGEQVGVMSVLAAGRATAGVALDNLGLLRGYGIRSAQNHAVTYTDGAFEEFADRHPTVPFTHIFPGGVSTPMVTSFPIVKFALPLMSPILLAPEECAEIMWSRLWDADRKWRNGAFQVNNHGADIHPKNQYVTPELREAVWKHAVEMAGEREAVNAAL